jgi:predicted nucleotidyltransferase component of viral defense system
MIQRKEIDAMAEYLEVKPSQVQKDYVHGWLLSLLYSSSILADRLVLKGGNCLRKGYFEHSRYSDDLDFTTSVGIAEEELYRELNTICLAMTERTGVVFDTSKTIVAEKRNIDAERKVAEAKLYFTDFYGKNSSLDLRVRLDVTQFDRLYLPVQERQLIHPYSDSEACRATIKCVKLEEMMASKMRCLLQRKHIADLYDLVYATIINPVVDVNRTELLSTFFKITIFGRSPAVAKGLFLDLPMEALHRFWNKYIICPNISWFGFEKAKASFLEFIHAVIPGKAEQERSPIYFPSTLRNPILEAADKQTMIRLTYHGVVRLVEPYELAFKVTKQGQAREYFYGYDTTGGRTSGPSIKSFLPGDVQAIEVTDINFEPRYEIKTSQSGGAETVSRFYGNRRASLGRLLGISRPFTRKGRRSYTGGTTYTVECPVCNKTFRRSKRSTKLNKHKNQYGRPCTGRVGYIV